MDQRDGTPCKRQISASRTGVVPTSNAGAEEVASAVTMARGLPRNHPEAPRTAMVVLHPAGVVAQAAGSYPAQLRARSAMSSLSLQQSNVCAQRSRMDSLMLFQSSCSYAAMVFSSLTARQAGR